MADDGFHEIQLNSKQLIFLCMTAALVLVVAFLSGVLVGRGVRSEKEPSLVADAAASGPASPADATAAAPPPAAQAAAPPPPGLAPPTPADEDVTYEKRLEGKQPPKETLEPLNAAPPSAAPGKAGTKEAAAGKGAAANTPKAGAPAVPAPAKDAVPTKDVAAAKTSASAEAPKGKADASLAGEPAGAGYYLKCMAVKDRGQAEGEAKRLTGKGYNAYVVPVSNLYSVRVGKYKTRKEADSIRRRLEKEERLKPLISH